jgi:hypothetical protein
VAPPAPTAAAAPAAEPLHYQWRTPASLNAWLYEEDIEMDTPGATNVPIVQVMIEDVQPDGTAWFRAVARSRVEGEEPLRQVGFVNSDVVDIQQIYDATGNEVTFKSIHQDGRFQYTFQLREPLAPGSELTYGSQGIIRNQIEEREPGVFSYRAAHYPNSGVPTRRVEVYRLPEGAELLEYSRNATSRVRNGRTEVVMDEIVPPGEGSELSYRYRYPSKR